MPGPIIHLAIANRIINELPEGIITNKKLFYAGSIAPDAIHSREGFVREDKKHSHLRDNITDIDFSKKENLTIFHNRVISFINDNMYEENIIDLFRGYVVHLLTDEMFLLTIRPDFVKEMDKLGIVPTDILFRDKIFHDLACNDFKLLKDNNKIKDILSLLRNVQLYCVEGYITEKELRLGIDWVIDKYLNEEAEDLEPIYIEYKKILTFIDETAHDIISRLSNGITFPRIF